MTENGWTKWEGGARESCPIEEWKAVQVKFRNEGVCTDIAGNFEWHHEWEELDIIAYRQIENDGREG